MSQRPKISQGRLHFASRFSVCTLIAFATIFHARAADVTLWFNGDPTYLGSGMLNEQALGPSRTESSYNDFMVTAPAGWQIHHLWAYDEIGSAAISQVAWSVRSECQPATLAR